MKNSIISFSVTILLLVSGTNAVKAQSEAEFKQKIESINKQIAKAMLAGDHSANLNYYTADAVSLPNNMEMIQGIDAIKKSNEELAQMGIKFKTFETKTLQIKVYDKIITEIGTYNMIMSMPGAPQDFQDHGKYLTIWEKQADGSLKIKAEMWNTSVNQMGGQM